MPETAQASESSEKLFTIGKTAELTGLSEHTLRAWERRYELLAPPRNASGYRLYDERTLGRIRAMQDLVRAGWSPKSAAAELVKRPPAELDALGADSFAELMKAAVDLDAGAVHRVIADRFAHGSFEAVVDGWLMPALTRLGKAWADGEVTVAGEHLVANTVMRRLAEAYDTARRGAGRPVLLGAPPGVDHQIGLFACAVACRRAGIPAVYLGAKVPLPAWRDAVTRTHAFAVVTAVPQRRDVERVIGMSDVLTGELPGRPGVPVWVGGRYQDLVPAPARPLGHLIGAAAAKLAASRHDEE